METAVSENDSEPDPVAEVLGVAIRVATQEGQPNRDRFLLRLRLRKGMRPDGFPVLSIDRQTLIEVQQEIEYRLSED